MLLLIYKRQGMLVTVYCQRTPSKLCRAEGSSVSPPVWPSCGTLQHYLNGLLFYIPWILRPLQEPRIHWTFAECRQKGWTHGRVQKYPSPLFFSKYYNTLLPLWRLRMTFWILGFIFHPWILHPLEESRIHWTFAEYRQKRRTHSCVQK